MGRENRAWKRIKSVWKRNKSLVWIPLVLLFSLLWFVIPQYSRQADPDQACPPAPEAVRQPVLAKGIVPISLVLESAEGMTVNMWRDRAVRQRTIFLQASKSQTSRKETTLATLNKQMTFNTAKRPLERKELDGSIGPSQYSAISQVTGQKEIGLTVCLDPRYFSADPGTYVGSVRISGRAIQPVTVPLTVTLQYVGYQWVVWIIGIVTFFAGTFVVWAAGKKAAAAEAQEEKPLRSIWRDLRELGPWIANNYIGVVGGAIAATSVYLSKYWRSAPWGASAPEDWFALLGGMFTAYTATLTAASALLPSMPGRAPSEDVTGAGSRPGE
jgi:hypothetical protein